MGGSWLKTKTHRDGTVSYFSDIENKWFRNMKKVPQIELDKMANKERHRILKWLGDHETR